MKDLCKCWNDCVCQFKALTDIPPLLLRLLLAYGFYGPAMAKLGNFDNIATWFGSLGIPLPYISAILATAAETLAVPMLLLGLGTRLISLPLMFVMLVAIGTVHWGNGFAAGGNGFEIPLYYMAMLFTLLVWGPGKLSVDEYACDSGCSLWGSAKKTIGKKASAKKASAKKAPAKKAPAKKAKPRRKK